MLNQTRGSRLVIRDRVVRGLAVTGRALVFCGLLTSTAHAVAAQDVSVTSAAELISAINSAQPGHVITLAPGTYTVSQNLLADTAGTSVAPITVRAAALGEGLIRFDAVEGFKVSQPYWVFENLLIRGVCASDSSCEHAFHLFGDADWTVIRNNDVRDYNAHIKSNQQGGDFPDDVLVEGNVFRNSRVRATSNPVTPIDVVGGRRWIIRSNLIADHAKGQGNQISYAAFLKGNSKDGLFERNLVVCEHGHTAGIRLGLSFGGGGSGPPSICEEGTCTPEHEDGVMRNNLIVNCPDDVGVYVNEGLNVDIHNNTLFNTTGIDIRFAASVANLRNNVIDGPIRERDSGTAILGTNLLNLSLAAMRSYFTDPDHADFTLLSGTAIVDQGETLALVVDDYCGNLRDDGVTDLGAVEYDGEICQTAHRALDVFSSSFETADLALWSVP